MDTLRIRQPDDWHMHLREGATLPSTVRDAARCFRRVIAMPNLHQPVTTTALALAYREEILAARPAGSAFEPLMTLYLTDVTNKEEIRRAGESDGVVAVKYYPAGATTHSDAGVRDILALDEILDEMRRQGLPLLVHGEVTRADVDIFDREAVFIDEVLGPLVERHAGLKVILEHITTQDAASFVREGPATLAATITPHHLLLNRNDLLVGGVRPHHFCLPVLKRERHRMALRRAATSEHPRFFIGTDSAPHSRSAKECSCGAAGIYSAASALELYAEVFEEEGALSRLEDFASRRGPAFYGLAVNPSELTLRKSPWQVPRTLRLGEETVVPFWAGRELQWQIEDAEDKENKKDKENKEDKEDKEDNRGA